MPPLYPHQSLTASDRRFFSSCPCTPLCRYSVRLTCGVQLGTGRGAGALPLLAANGTVDQSCLVDLRLETFDHWQPLPTLLSDLKVQLYPLPSPKLSVRVPDLSSPTFGLLVRSAQVPPLTGHLILDSLASHAIGTLKNTEVARNLSLFEDYLYLYGWHARLEADAHFGGNFTTNASLTAKLWGSLAVGRERDSAFEVHARMEFDADQDEGTSLVRRHLAPTLAWP